MAKIQQAAPSAKVHAAVFDLGDAAGCAALVAQFPDVDILVNNLGIYEPKAFFDIEDADWTRDVRSQRHERGAADAALSEADA